MGKKRKAGGRPFGQTSEKENEPAMRTKYDINETFDESEDEFQAGRDQILLEEGPEAKRRRKLQEQEEFFQPSDEEVLGYDDVDEDELDEEDEDEDVDDEDDYDENDMRELSKKSKKLRDASPDPDVADRREEEEEEDGIGAWGSSRKDFYNADNIETEADALEEEEEAKKIQQKRLQTMKEADFGLDESEWLESGKDKEDEEQGQDGVVTEVLPQLEITDDMGADERLKILKSRYPEFEPLAKDFVDLQATYRDLQKSAKEAEAATKAEDPTPVAVIKLRALAAYLASISIYFMLLTSSSESNDEEKHKLAMAPGQLREHPVMESLVEHRKLWEEAKDLQEPDDSEPSAAEKSDEDVEMTEAGAVETEKPTKKEEKKKKKGKEEKAAAPKKLTKAQRAALAAQEEAEARRAERIRETEAGLADLSKLIDGQGKKPKAQTTAKVSFKGEDSDFGDEDALTAHEAEEKAKQKRSLRFYTSQMAQKSNKRSAAGRNAGGDEDLPYRERLKDRQARLLAEAEKRGRKQATERERLGGDSDEEDHRLAGEVRGDAQGSDDDDYYDMVAARAKKRKEEKKARADAYAEAAKQGGRVEVEEEIGPDGKRKITYQIEKNKGLAPKRSKDVRNPRVKKRKKFEQKQKRLGSIRQVYKGGEGPGGYGGELTGIKKNLVKSVKL
ncbi:hypothetical protein VTN02DRAFT_1476 [Thermoascus thermophilus]